jgi:hypothetical protein
MYQQQWQQQQAMNPNGYHPNPYATPSQGPTMNSARMYQGPQPPNPMPASSGVMPAGYAAMQPAGSQAVAPQYAVATQVEQTIRVLRESPYPSQREWAAQSLVSFDWRTNPQLVPVLLQSATRDPAASVRAGCIYTLGRMQAAVEPVFSTLQALRNDADPRVRQEVEQAFIRLGGARSN